MISKGKEKGEPGSPSPETPSVPLRDLVFTEEIYEAALSGVSEERLAASDSEELPSPCWLECRTSRNVDIGLKKE